MYVLFSLTILFFGSVACEQRPELRKSVEFTSQSTKEESITSPEETTTENSDVVKEKSKKNGNEKSVQNEENVVKDDGNPSQIQNSYEKKPFQLKSSEMGLAATEKAKAETQSEVATSNPEIVNVDSLDFVGGWPVQVIGILEDLHPKRALLRRANGTEISVKAGQFINEERLVVLAIGKNHVSLAKIHPKGNLTTIQQMDLQPLD